MAVTIYSTAICPYCTRAKALLEQHNIAYEELRIDEDENLRMQMLERSGGARSVPQIFIGNHHVGGCDDLYGLSTDEIHKLVDNCRS